MSKLNSKMPTTAKELEVLILQVERDLLDKLMRNDRALLIETIKYKTDGQIFSTIDRVVKEQITEWAGRHQAEVVELVAKRLEAVLKVESIAQIIQDRVDGVL